MRSKEYVNETIKKIKILDSFFIKKEIKELPKILHENEELLYITSGLFNNNTWLVVSTNERVIFLDKGMFWGLTQIETPLDKINSIGYKTGLIFGSISIFDGQGHTIINMVDKRTLKPFVDSVNEARNKLASKKNINQIAQTTNSTIALELERLMILKENGLINDEELNQAKTKILA